MSDSSAPAAPTWSRVDDGFFVASRAGDFLGFVDAGDDGFAVYDAQGALMGHESGLAAAMDRVAAQGGAEPEPDTSGSELVSTVYTSFATTRFDDERLATLLDESRFANAGRDVTGMLLYREGRFLQVLEGPRDTVSQLVETIRGDRRHHDVRVLIVEPIEQRRFADWTMAFRPWVFSPDRLPPGFRDSFDDLEDADDTDAVRAMRELMLWFRYRLDRDEVAAD